MVRMQCEYQKWPNKQSHKLINWMVARPELDLWHFGEKFVLTVWLDTSNWRSRKFTVNLNKTCARTSHAVMRDKFMSLSQTTRKGHQLYFDCVGWLRLQSHRVILFDIQCSIDAALFSQWQWPICRWNRIRYSNIMRLTIYGMHTSTSQIHISLRHWAVDDNSYWVPNVTNGIWQMCVCSARHRRLAVKCVEWPNNNCVNATLRRTCEQEDLHKYPSDTHIKHLRKSTHRCYFGSVRAFHLNCNPLIWS